MATNSDDHRDRPSLPNDPNYVQFMDDTITLNGAELSTRDTLGSSNFESSQALSDTSPISFDDLFSEDEADTLIQESGMNLVGSTIGFDGSNENPQPSGSLLQADQPEETTAVVEDGNSNKLSNGDHNIRQALIQDPMTEDRIKSDLARGKTVLIVSGDNQPPSLPSLSLNNGFGASSHHLSQQSVVRPYELQARPNQDQLHGAHPTPPPTQAPHQPEPVAGPSGLCAFDTGYVPPAQHSELTIEPTPVPGPSNPQANDGDANNLDMPRRKGTRGPPPRLTAEQREENVRVSNRISQRRHRLCVKYKKLPEEIRKVIVEYILRHWDEFPARYYKVKRTESETLLLRFIAGSTQAIILRFPSSRKHPTILGQNTLDT